MGQLVTLEEYLALCAAEPGTTPDECRQRAADQSVGGQFCDGRIVMDEHGKRCVPRAVYERKAEAAKASPLPPRARASEARSGLPLALGALAIVGLVVVGAVLAARKRA